MDTDQDNEISLSEARAVTSVEAMLGTSLSNATFTSFDEFGYFTGIKKLPAGSFNGWMNLTTITLPESIETIEINFRDQADAGTSPEKTIFWNCPKLNSIKGKDGPVPEIAESNRRLRQGHRLGYVESLIFEKPTRPSRCRNRFPEPHVGLFHLPCSSEEFVV